MNKTYAKVKGDTLIKYPYTIQDLYEENPHTEYDSRFDLYGWYIQTEDAIKNGNTLVEIESPPDLLEEYKSSLENDPRLQGIDLSLYKLVVKTTPEKIDGVWKFGEEILPLTENEKLEYQKQLST